MVFALAFLGALAYLLWPIRLGGAATFVVVRGHSMEGTYSQGDFLYARTSSHYAVGDIAIYRIPKGRPGAGALVVHRITARLPGGRFLFQGDNKPAPDDVTPTRADLVAKPILDLSSVPTRLLIVAPLVFTILCGIAVTVALWPGRRVDAPESPESDAEPADAVDIDEVTIEAGDRVPWGSQPQPDAPIVTDPTAGSARIGP
jgi:hypothetical protein